MKTVLSESKEFTQRIGESIASLLQPGDVILLQGDLGAGKTTFTAGVARGLGINDPVISPTFNILKCYFNGRLPLYHIDAYRLEGQNIEIGLDEAIEGDGVCLIEWPQFIESLLPDERLEITFTHQGEDRRDISFSAKGGRFEGIIERLGNSL